MIPFYVMLAGIAIARAAGLAGIRSLDDWHVASRVGLAIMFVLTGTAHFTSTRRDLVRTVPPQLPAPEALQGRTPTRKIFENPTSLDPRPAFWTAHMIS
jgi:hypothetical protein